MSRLIDEFRKATQTAAQPMGFRAARSKTSAPRMPIIAGIQIKTGTNSADYADGASAVLFRAGKTPPTVKTMQALVKTLPDIPCGVCLDDYDEIMVGEGCDFVVFSSSGSISAAPQDEKIGRILQVESSMDDGLLRAVSDLPVDAVLVADTLEGGDSLVWHQLMILQHLTRLISKPLIVAVSASIGEKELNALWEVGVDGLLVDSSSAGALKELRKAGKIFR